jgi:cobalt-zinc-cadmium efflux system membrane fusion protein
MTNHEPRTPDPGSRIPDPGSPIPDPVIALTPEMISRAGIKTVAAVKGTSTNGLHLPGVVQPNAYKDVAVTALVSGRITQVRAELGQRVMLNEALATVYSPELADAQTAFIAARAEHLAHDQRQARTQRLYAIGAASRQELESLEAERTRMDQEVETARARLVLLGIPEERTQRLASPLDVVTSFEVRAPIAGVITKRNANPGLNVDLSTPLFTVTDLSDVWVIADLYERNFATVGVGSPATITTTSYPGLELKGRVDYIDPQVEEQTRTAKLRVELPNAGNRLRLGMFVDVSIAERSPRPVVLIPKAALQTVGTRSVVYVAANGEPGRFLQREVLADDTIGNQVAVLKGIQPGDLVVTDGAFFLRAEHERTAPNSTGAAAPADVVFPSTRP